MTTVTAAKIILDSVSPAGAHITTMQLVYPRFIHSEAKTHRVMNIGDEQYTMMEDVSFMNAKELSRNASSSRAIPVAKMIEQVRTDPAMPIHWGTNQPGMQAGEEVSPEAMRDAIALWRHSANMAANIAETMSRDLGLHKQVANRLLEPFQWMHVIVTSTEWDNFFNLRLHPAADPNIHELARVMKIAMNESTPVVREMHAPYTDEMVVGLDFVDDIALTSSGRCARVSYLNHDGSQPNQIKDLALARMLRASGHASPFEHVAFAAAPGAESGRFDRYANFRGWQSYRNRLGI